MGSGAGWLVVQLCTFCSGTYMYPKVLPICMHSWAAGWLALSQIVRLSRAEMPACLPVTAGS